jgi:DMSO/TMAO reductase YedYZ molybdopterin-dependent catalytic subunit
VPARDPAAEIEGLTPLFVANEDFYRIDTALLIPRVSTADWALAVDGMVANPLRLTYDDLWERRLVEYDVTLSCVSNEVGGDLVGNARWLGVRLDELLAEAAIQPDADQIMGHSVDGFTAGFPVDALADGRNAIVALAMNGEVLPVAHGYPARLVVPGLYGYVSATKWLSRIELTRFDRDQGYWIPRGWAERAPIKTQSRIDTPHNGSTVEGTVAIAGVAWAPTRGIARVEVQVDDGPWQEATLGPAVSASSWRQWWWAWTAPPGRHRLRCRATDGTGATQTEDRSRPDPDGATGWHTIEVEAG